MSDTKTVASLTPTARISSEPDVIIDFQQHYTPPELLKGERNTVSVRLDQNGNPNSFIPGELNPNGI